MNAVTEIVARIFAQRGFLQVVINNGADNSVVPSDLTASQAQVIDACANDSGMQYLVEEVFARYEIIKRAHDLNAEPWYDDIAV